MLTVDLAADKCEQWGQCHPNICFCKWCAHFETRCSVHSMESGPLTPHGASPGFGNENSTGTPDPIQPHVGVYNEAGLQRLDYILMTAANYGQRVILTLVNYEDGKWNAQA